MGVYSHGEGVEKALSTIIAVDFDGTLVEDKFPDIGPIRKEIWNNVHYLQRKGCKLILWTSRNGEALKQAVEFCAQHSLHFDAINENLDEIKVMYGGDTRKVYADFYLDDRSAAFLDDYVIKKIPLFQGC